MQYRHSTWVVSLIAIVTINYLARYQLAFAIETLPEITVSVPRPPLAEHINNTQQLDEDAIAVAHERSVADVIRGFSGISASKTAGFGQPGSLFLRRSGGQGLVSLDGIPVILTVPGLLNLDTLPPESIKSVEIERGPNPAYHPFQSLGGAIRLQTQDREDTGGRLSVEGSGFGILRETLQGRLKGDYGRVMATFSRADAFDGVNLANQKHNPEREPNHLTQGILRFSSKLNDRLNWQGTMLYRNLGAGIDTFGINKGIVIIQDDANSHAHEENWLTQTKLDYKVNDNWRSQLQLGYTQAKTFLNAGPVQNGVFTRLFLANWRNQHKLIDDEAHERQWLFTWGAQGRHEQGLSPTSQFHDHRTMTAGFIDTQFQIGDFSGQTGLRLESFDRFSNHLLFKTAGAYRITTDFTLRASAGNGFRLPSYTELLFLFFGNPNLKPELATSGDVCLEWFPIKNLRLTANGYYQRFHDLITPAYGALQGPITVNVPDADIAGLELDVQYTWDNGLEAGLGYGFSDNTLKHQNKEKVFPHT